MGKQINFYFSNADQTDLARGIDEMDQVCAILPPFEGFEINCSRVSDFSVWHSGEDFPLLFRSVDREELVFRKKGGNSGFTIDLFRSPVAEFSRCIVSNSTIRAGRLFYIEGYVDDRRQRIDKSPEFCLWAKRLFSIVKKLSTRTKDGIYVGRDADKLVSTGYDLRSN